MLIPLFCPLHCFFFTYSSLVCCLDKGFFASLLSHIIHTIHILALKGNMFVYNTHTDVLKFVGTPPQKTKNAQFSLK